MKNQRFNPDAVYTLNTEAKQFVTEPETEIPKEEINSDAGISKNIKTRPKFNSLRPVERLTIPERQKRNKSRVELETTGKKVKSSFKASSILIELANEFSMQQSLSNMRARNEQTLGKNHYAKHAINNVLNPKWTQKQSVKRKIMTQEETPTPGPQGNSEE